MKSMAAYQIEFTKSAKKEFDKLPESAQDKVLEAVKLLSVNPYSDLLQVKKMRGADFLYRLRVGDYRIIYEVQNKKLIIIIIKIGHRRDVYRGF